MRLSIQSKAQRPRLARSNCAFSRSHRTYSMNDNISIRYTSSSEALRSPQSPMPGSRGNGRHIPLGSDQPSHATLPIHPASSPVPTSLCDPERPEDKSSEASVLLLLLHPLHRPTALLPTLLLNQTATPPGHPGPSPCLFLFPTL